MGPLSTSRPRQSDGVMDRRSTSSVIAQSVVRRELTSGMLGQATLAVGEQSAQTAVFFLTGCARQSRKQSIYGMG